MTASGSVVSSKAVSATDYAAVEAANIIADTTLVADSYATLQAGGAIENVTVVANGNGLASRADKAIEILGAASVTGSSFTANYGSFGLNDDTWTTKLDRFADSDVIVRNGAVEIGLTDADRGVVENVSVNGNGTISVNATPHGPQLRRLRPRRQHARHRPGRPEHDRRRVR